MDKWGRRVSLAVSALLFDIGAILMVTSVSWIMLALARMVAGVGIGIVVLTIPYTI